MSGDEFARRGSLDGGLPPVVPIAADAPIPRPVGLARSRSVGANNHLDDLEVAINRLREIATEPHRYYHPATPAEIRRCLDDLADTVERMRG